MPDDPSTDRPAREPKDFRRQAHSFEGERGEEGSQLKLPALDVKGHNLGAGLRDLPLVGVVEKRPKRRK
jgi:hypothetical protein